MFRRQGRSGFLQWFKGIQLPQQFRAWLAPGPVVNATAAATTAAASAAEASPAVTTHGSPVVDWIVHGVGPAAPVSGVTPAVTVQSPTQPTSPTSPAYATATSNYGQLPLTFKPNQGQTDSSVSFISQSAGFGFFLTDTAAVFQLTHPAAQGDSTSGDVLALTFDNANATPEVYGVDDTGGRTNYFTGSAATDMLTNVPEYAQVVVQDLYPGINLVLTSTAQRNVEYNFDVAPGASLSEVQLTWNGATSLSLDQQGNLLIGTSGGNVTPDAPVFYQTDSNGQQVPVTGQQVLLGGNTFGFAATGSYDSSSPLVVDPTLDFSTYLGGSGNDDAYGIAVDGTGNSYITGSTASTNFPTTTGAFTSGSGAGTEVFVTKLSSTSSEIYSAYISGTTSGSNAQGNAIAVDLGGNAYVVGTVSGTFPAYNTSTGNDNVPYSSGSNAFLLELNASGDAMPYARYLDPTDTTTTQLGKAIAVTPQGIIYVGGTVAGAYGTSGTIWKTVSGGAITTIQSFGGSSGHVEAITVTGIAANGSWVYLTGSIAGTGITGTTGAYQLNDAGLTDAFVFRPPGVALPGGHTAFTFLGGSGADSASGIAIMPSGNILVSGTTSSSNFPTTTGAYQTTLAGTSDAFVAELGSNLNYLAYSTYLGGSGSGGAGTQSATGIAINTSGLITVVGSTNASNFPTSNSLYSFVGATDGFITQFTPNFAGLNYSSLFGGADVGSSLGTATNVVTGVATDLQGDVYVAGYTNSTDFPTSSGAIQGSNAAGYDAFLSEILNTPAAPVFTGISPASSASTITITSSQNIHLLGTGTSGATVTVSLRGVGVLGTTTVSGGTWNYDYSGTTLAAGTYDFTATQTISTVVSPPTSDYLVTIAPAGAPTVGLSAPSSTYSLEPSFRVTASDPNGSLGTATVSLLVYNSTGSTLLSTTSRIIQQSLTVEILGTITMKPRQLSASGNLLQKKIVILLMASIVLLGKTAGVTSTERLTGSAAKQSHEGAIVSLSFFSDGKLLISGGVDGKVQSHEVRNAVLGNSKILQCGKWPQFIISHTNDRKKFAIYGSNGADQICVWDISKLDKPIAIIDAEHDVLAAAFSPDGKRLALYNGESEIYIWDLRLERARKYLTIKGFRDGVRAFIFSDKEELITAGANPGEENELLQFWDISNAMPKLKRSTECSGQTKTLVYGICDKSMFQAKYVDNLDDVAITRFDRFTGQSILQTVLNRVGRQWKVAISDNGSIAVTGNHVGSITCWEISTGKKLGQWKILNPVTSVAISSNGAIIAIADSTGIIYTTRLANEK